LEEKNEEIVIIPPLFLDSELFVFRIRIITTCSNAHIILILI